MNQITRALGILLVSSMLSTGCGDQSEPDAETRFDTSQLVGQWESPDCETGGSPGSEFYYKRVFDFTATTWGIDFTLYADDACQTASSTASISGPFEVSTPSDQIDGAWRADFTGATKTLVAYDEGTAGFFESSNCGEGSWSVNEPKDIARTGCAPLGLDAVEACPVEFDLIRLEGDALFFGDRSSGMCDVDNRTQTLQPVPVKKQL